MPSYIYKCEIHDEFEAFHSIKEKLEFCPICKEKNVETAVKRLIAGGNFQLIGQGWAKDNYHK